MVVSEEDIAYIKKRDKLIPSAAALADQLVDAKDENWGYIYFNEMDRLAFETKLTAVRFHKPLGRGFINPRERRNS